MSEGEDKGPVEPPAPEEQTKTEELPKIEEKNEDDQLEEEEQEELKKSEDKLEIEAEERDKMIEDIGEKQEPKRVLGEEVEKKKKALEEAALEGPKRRVPIGGIKIPGFLRPKSRDKPKEGEQGEAEEGVDLLEQEGEKKDKEVQEQPSTLARLGLARLGLDKIKFSNPFARFTKESRRAEGGEGEEKEGEGSGSKRPRLLNAVKLPLASVLPKLRPVNQNNKEGEAGGPAGLASVETLGDADSQGRIDENNMENVRLENHEIDAEKAALEEEAESKWAAKDWRFYTKRFYEFRYPIIGLLILLLLLIILIVLAVCSGPEIITESPLIDGKYVNAITSCGPVQGVSDKGTFVFRSIPYALPPVGFMRWSTPKPFTLRDCWNGTLKVHNRTESCWAFDADGKPKGSEDCLTLDIITPSVRYHSPMPVIVFLGDETFTGGANIRPPVTLAAEKEVVLVIPRYRLGPFGFLAAKPLSDSTYPYSSGNYGMHDVVAALKWVRLNIVHFGGNNRTVTVLAHRAAATLVTALTSTIKVEKLFDRAWLSSSSTIFPNTTLLNAEKTFETYFSNIKCSDNPTVECLRRQEALDLMEAVPEEWRQNVGSKLPSTTNESLHSWLVMDGLLLRMLPQEFWSVRNTSVQVVLGTTQHSEWFPKEAVNDWDEEKVIGELKSSILAQEGLVDEVIRRYGNTLRGLQSVVADIRTVCPLVNLHKDMTNSKLYLVTQPRGNFSDGKLDIESILGLYKGVTSQEKGFVSRIRKLFFDFAIEGQMPRHSMFKLGQETLPVKEFDNCQFWADNNFASYARVD